MSNAMVNAKTSDIRSSEAAKKVTGERRMWRSEARGSRAMPIVQLGAMAGVTPPSPFEE